MARIDEYEIGKNVRRNIKIQLDMNKIEKGVFGIFNWRLIWLKVFIFIASVPFGSDYDGES